MIRGDSLEPADCNGFVFDADTTACRFTGAVAYAPQNAWKHVGLAVFHVRIAELPLGNHADIRWNVGVGGTAPLAVYDLVKVIGIAGICWLHANDKPAWALFTGALLESLKGR